MKPFLFPFTYIDTPELTACGQFFQGLKVFQFSNKTIPPEMQTDFDSGKVEAVMPDPDTRLSFETALAETESWAQSHRLGAASYAKGHRNRIPFFDASSVAQIRQDIRRIDQQAQPADTHENETMAARIFLQMAQFFDVQNRSIVQQMHRQASMEKTLYEELRGDAALAHLDFEKEFDDPAQYMLLDRLKAWSRVWTTTSDSHDLFVTTRQAVIALIQEHFPKNIDFLPIATLPAIGTNAHDTQERYRDLWIFCHQLVTADPARITESGLLDTYPPTPGTSDGIQIHWLPGISPGQLFGYLCEQTDSTKTRATNGVKGMNTVIGLIETEKM